MLQPLEIIFSESGHSPHYVLEGWGPVETGHRWAVGRESRVRLPVADPGPDCVIVVHLAPWTDPACLPAQTLMLSVNDRLLSTVQLSDQRVLALRCPAGPRTNAPAILSFCHLHARVPRPPAGQDKDGLPLGVMVLSIRLFRVPPPEDAPQTRTALAGSIADGSLQRAATVATGESPDRLATAFESIGQNCEFGLVRREFGAEPLGLLRFAGVVTPKLVEGLLAGFAGVGAAETSRVLISPPPKPEFKLHEERYYLWYSTGRTEANATHASVHREQCRRLRFLQRKFVEDLREGHRIHVLTRSDNLSEAEALAVFCALNVTGRNTLLWTVFGDPARTGEVDRLMPGFLCGHLGPVDSRQYGS